MDAVAGEVAVDNAVHHATSGDQNDTGSAQLVDDGASRDADNPNDMVDGGKLHSKIRDEVKSEMEVLLKTEIEQVRSEVGAQFLAQIGTVKAEMKADASEAIRQLQNTVQTKLESQIEEAKNSTKAEWSNALDLFEKGFESRHPLVAELAQTEVGISIQNYVQAQLTELAGNLQAKFQAKLDDIESGIVSSIQGKLDDERAKIHDAIATKIDDTRSEMKRKMESMQSTLCGDLLENGAFADKIKQFENQLENRLTQIEIGFETGFLDAKKKTKEKMKKMEERVQEMSRGHIVKWFTLTIIFVLSCTALSIFNAVRPGGASTGNTDL